MVHKTGDNGMNNLTGTNGDDWLEGLGGNDFLHSSLGKDKLDGGAGDNDFAVYTGSATGVNVNLVTGIATGQGQDTLIGIECIDGSFFNDVIRLTTGENFANGNGGNDIIYAMGGSQDSVLGGDGNDQIFMGNGNEHSVDGQQGNDFIQMGEGEDSMAAGGDGTDTVSYKDVSVGITLNLYYDEAYGGYDQLNNYKVYHQIQNFENAEGTNFADIMWGDELGNNLKGLNGADEIHGYDGNDEVYGGDGNDWLYGDKGNDKVYGDGGADNLYGNEDYDELYGGVGNDTLWAGELMVGGAGKDVMHGFGETNIFKFNAVSDSVVGANRDHIVDLFRSEGDKIDLSAIDAKVGQGGNQAFSFIGSNAFSAAGQVRVINQGNNGWLVQGSTDSDAQAEFEIQVLFASQPLQAVDFLL